MPEQSTWGEWGARLRNSAIHMGEGWNGWLRDREGWGGMAEGWGGWLSSSAIHMREGWGGWLSNREGWDG